jgi:O-antigen ligase
MDVIKKNGQLIFIVLLWIVSGYGGQFLPLATVPLTVYIMKRRGMYKELLVGFFILLTLSDSRSLSLEWAASAKNEYIVMLAVFIFLDRKSFSPFSYFYQRFVPFFLVATICLFFSPENVVSISIQKTLSYFFLLLVVSNYVIKCHRDYGGEFFKSLMFAGGAILTIGLIAKFINPSLATFEGRFRGLLGNPNAIGIYVLLLFLTFALIRERYPELFSNTEKTVLFGLMFLALFLSNSRNSLFAIVIFIFFSYFYKLSPYLGFIIFLVFLLIYQSVEANLADIIVKLGLGDYFRVNTLQDASGRYIAWNFAKDHIKESPWLGRGFDFTEDLFLENEVWLNNIGHQGNAHNSYLTLWLDTGLLGLSLYLYAMASSFIQAAKKSNLALPAMYAIIFSSIFESWLAASLNPFTIQLVIILTMFTSEAIYPSKTKIIVPLQ